MSNEELAKHRQEYWDELVRYMKSYRFGPPADEIDLKNLFALISDDEIIRNVESGYSPLHTIEPLVYYTYHAPMPKEQFKK